jgi:hypothetical protein
MQNSVQTNGGQTVCVDERILPLHAPHCCPVQYFLLEGKETWSMLRIFDGFNRCE